MLQGILRQTRSKSEKAKQQSVSFQPNETEVIGFGGEEYSSDDDSYPDFDNPYDGVGGGGGLIETEENSEEEKKFRELTQTNTDFNSNPSNLRTDKLEKKNSPPKKMYADLKLGKPLVDADGRKQTLQVTVEPFKNSVTVNGGGGGGGGGSGGGGGNSLANDRKIHLNKILLESSCTNGNGTTTTAKKTEEKVATAAATESTDNSSTNRVICDIKTNSVNKENSVNIINVNVNETINEENIYVKCATAAASAPNSVLKITNVLVNSTKPEQDEVDHRKSSSSPPSNKEVVENMKNAKSKLEPLFKLGAYENGYGEGKRLSIYQTPSKEPESNGVSPTEEKRRSLTLKECKPINGMPLIMSKELDIEIGSPGSREMVGEPDGKADSDDSGESVPVINGGVSVEEKSPTKSTGDSDTSPSVNPRRSFLHGFIKEKPQPASKPVIVPSNGVMKKADALPVKEASEVVVSIFKISFLCSRGT